MGFLNALPSRWRSQSNNFEADYQRFLDDLRPLTIYSSKLSAASLFRRDSNPSVPSKTHTLRGPFDAQLAEVSTHVPNTCAWVTETSEYQAWRLKSTASKALLICANPGLGKSVLAKFINNEVRPEHGTHTTLTFFCRPDRSRRKSANSVLASFIYYLTATNRAQLRSQESFIQSIPTNWTKQDTPATFEVLWNIFLKFNTLPFLADCTFIIDGLDHCDHASKVAFRDNLRKSLSKLRARVLITSRPDLNINLARNVPTIFVHPKRLLRDLEVYSRHVMVQRGISSHVSQELETFIVEKVLQNARGFFLLCFCRLDAIAKWISENGSTNLWANLDSIILQPHSLVTAYSISLMYGLIMAGDRVKQRNGIAILNLMIAAPRQMTNDELTVAFVLRSISHVQSLSVYQYLIKPADILIDALDRCGPIVGVVDTRKSTSETERELYVVHPLVRQLFDSVHGLKLTTKENLCLSQISLSRGHSSMARACLTYLMFTDLPEPSPAAFNDHPFLRYALSNWPMHVKSSGNDVVSILDTLIKFFRSNSTGYRMWDRWALTPFGGSDAGPTPRPMIFVLAEQKLVNVIEHLVPEGQLWRLPASSQLDSAVLDLNLKHGGVTALFTALTGKSHEVAAALLKLGADPRIAGSHGITPLHLAVNCGSKQLIKLCHEKKADLDATTQYLDDYDGSPVLGESPLFWALGPEGNRRTEIFNFLYELGARNLTARNRKMPLLHLMASENDLEFTKYLIEQKIQSVEMRSEVGTTPLIEACRDPRSMQVVEYLINTAGANVSAVDSEKRSALVMALHSQSEDVARYLLQQKYVLAKQVLDLVDATGYTALHWAVVHHYTDLAKIMIDNGAAVNTKCVRNSTPLVWATKHKYTDLVRLLLKAGADPEASDSSGHPPLYVACEEAFHEIAEALIIAGAVGIKKAPNINVFHVVGMKNFISLARMLLASPLCKPDLLNAPGADLKWTPFMAAVNYKRYDVAKLLLKEDIDVTVADRDGRLPIHMVCNNTNDDELFDMILDKTPEHLIHARTERGGTTLSLAAGGGFLHAVKVLLAKGCDVASIDKGQQTPLILASRSKSGETVKAILENEQCLPDQRDKHGWKAIDYAGCNITDPDVLKTLTLRTTWQYQLGAPTNAVATAVYNHNPVALQVFLENGMSPHLTCDYGNTPLYDAVELEDGGHMTKLLLKHGADPNATTGFNILPWLCAFDTPSADTVELVRPTSVQHLSRKANTNFANALLQASKSSLQDCVWMIENSIDPTALSLYGSSVIHHAAYGRHPEILRYLLKIPKVKALINLGTRSYNMTALHCAANVRSPECIKVLLEAGADQEALDWFGRKALDFVVAYDEESPQIVDAECVYLLAPAGPPAYTIASAADPDAAQNRIKQGAPQLRAILQYLTDLSPDDYFFSRRERHAILMLGVMFLAMKDMPNALTAFEFDYGGPKQDFSGFIDCQCCAKQKARSVGYLCKVCTCIAICGSCKKDNAMLEKFGCADHELVQYPRETWLTRNGDHVNDDKQTKDEWLNSLRERYKHPASWDGDGTDELIVEWDYPAWRPNVFEMCNAGQWPDFYRHLARYPGDVSRLDDHGDDMVLRCIRTATDEDDCVSRLQRLKHEGARLLVYNGTDTSIDLACHRRWRKLTEFLIKEWDRRFDNREENSPVAAVKVMLEEDWHDAIKYAFERHFKWLNRGPFEPLKEMADAHKPMEEMIEFLKLKKDDDVTKSDDVTTTADTPGMLGDQETGEDEANSETVPVATPEAALEAEATD